MMISSRRVAPWWWGRTAPIGPSTVWLRQPVPLSVPGRRK